MINDIKEFHEKFELEYNGPARLLDKEDALFRIKFMQEELDEYIKACAENDLTGSLDALIDLIYVALGTAYRQGLPFKEGWDIVHACNMSKERALPDGANSKRGSKHDVVKPLDWVGPDYSKIL
jgi:predicted HAD superfamily Cof-like phosphohydrolase